MYGIIEACNVTVALCRQLLAVRTEDKLCNSADEKNRDHHGTVNLRVKILLRFRKLRGTKIINQFIIEIKVFCI